MTYEDFIQSQTLRISSLWFDSINQLYTEIFGRFGTALKEATDPKLLKTQKGKPYWEDPPKRRDKEELDIFFFLLLYDLLDDTATTAANVLKETTIFTHNADKSLFERAGIQFTPYEKDKFLQNLTQNRVDRVMEEIKEVVPQPPEPILPDGPTPQQAIDYTKSTAIKAIDSQGVARDIPDFYQKELDRAIASVRDGSMSYTEAIKRAVKALTEQGVVRVGYENGKPVRRSIEAVVRQNVLGAIGELAGKVTLANIIDLHPPYADVSAHIGARTNGSGTPADHLAWQGRRYELTEEFWKKYGNKEALLNG